MSTIERLERARLALEGLSVGDAFGRFYEYISLVLRPERIPDPIRERRLPVDTLWRWTDDTNMALSIYVNLREYGEIRQDTLAADFALRLDGERGYGSGAWEILTCIRQGEAWQVCAPSVFGGLGSYGNGAAMRVAPLGAFYADDLTRAAAEARLTAEITHSHEDGIAGAIAVAVGAALVWRAHAAGERPSRPVLIERVLPYVPAGGVRRGLEAARDLPPGQSSESVAAALGSGYAVAAHDTVPFALWCAGEWLDNYEEALWNTLLGMGDTDTNCAIVGGIVALYVGEKGIPALWQERREPLPAWALVNG
jgi:ADP-ribosylglycohydrolase